MKTVAQLKHRIEFNKHRIEFHFNEISKAERKRLFKQNAILLDLKSYLETNPTESFITSEKKRIHKIILAKQSQFYHWRTNVIPEYNGFSPDKLSRIFCKETGITVLRKQLKNLNFLLNENQEHPTTR